MSVSVEVSNLKRICRRAARPYQIHAGCLYGSRAGGYARPESDYDALLILNEYKQGLKFEYSTSEVSRVALLMVDQALFEQDVNEGTVGEFLSTRLLGPFVPIFDEQYLKDQELRVKGRVVEEELRGIVAQYGSMAGELLVAPEFFALARLRKMAGLYPALMYGYVKMLQGDLKDRNLPRITAGYRTVLNDAEERGLVKSINGRVRLDPRFVDRTMSRRSVDRVVGVLGMSRRIFYSYMSHGRGRDAELDDLVREVGSALGRGFEPLVEERRARDPREYLFLQTSSGAIQVSENRSAIEVAQRLRPGVPITVIPLASVLNEVYLVTAGEERFVMKRFTDWLTLKWFTLNVVALGTKRFSVMGRSRLSNEYAINRLLSEKGVNVPEVVHVNIPERVLMERYVDGLNVSTIVTEAATSDHLSASNYQTATELGRTLAKIHAFDVAVGDSKPENFIASSDKVIHVLDLEQGEKGGDAAWDVAELLFYSGHYTPLMTPGLTQFVDGFVSGYRDEGDAKVLQKAASISYIRVFSVWTSPQVLYKISQRLKEPQG